MEGKNQKEVIALLEQARQPVSIDYVAHNLGVAWVTARAWLFELALEGAIIATKTTKSWIFSLPEKAAKQYKGGST